MFARTTTPKSGTRTRVAAVALTATVALGATAGAAAASDGSAAQSTKGAMKAGGIDVTFEAQRAAGAKATDATGTFTAEGAPVAAMGLPKTVGSIRLAGPISCLETHGEDVSFYYEFDKTSTSGVLDKLGAGMIVTLRKNGADDYKMGFTPMLSSMVPTLGCDSSLAPLSVTSGGWKNGS